MNLQDKFLCQEDMIYMGNTRKNPQFGQRIYESFAFLTRGYLVHCFYKLFQKITILHKLL